MIWQFDRKINYDLIFRQKESRLRSSLVLNTRPNVRDIEIVVESRANILNSLTNAAAIVNIGTQGVQELFFCDLKAPGGRSTRWTHKGNSFMSTGVPDSSQRHYKV